MAPRRLRRQTVAVRQARAPEIQSRGHRRAFGRDQRHSAGGAVPSHTVIARSEATNQSILSLRGEMDCFASLAMTELMAGDGRLFRCYNGPLNFPKPDPIAVALAPAAHHK